MSNRPTTFIVTVEGADEAELGAFNVKDAISATGLVESHQVSVVQLRPGITINTLQTRGRVVEAC